MRLVFVCDEYPPFDRGGYSQLCFDLAGALRKRGNQVTVLCPQADGQSKTEESVVRSLHLPIKPGSFPIPIQQVAFAGQRRRHNSRQLKSVLVETHAEALVFWPNLYLDPQLMRQAEYENCLVAYYVAGFSPAQPFLLEQYWSHPGRSKTARLAKTLLRPFLGPRNRPAICLGMKHLMCVSKYERERAIRGGVGAGNAVVIHNGVDLDEFRFLGLPSTRRQSGMPLRVLYAGRLAETKGAHVIIEALRFLHQTNPDVSFHLALLGTGKQDYVQDLDQRILAYGLVDQVKRHEWMQRDRVPDLMGGFDILVLPTLHPEPLARAVQEAMAIGLVVIATCTGGTPEIVQDGVTGLLIPPDDPRKLAKCLLRVHADVGLSDQLAGRALDLIKAEFTIQCMAERVERQIALWMSAETCSVPSRG